MIQIPVTKALIIIVIILSVFILIYFTIQTVEIQIKQFVIEKTHNQLITIRDSKKNQLITYLTELHKQTQLYARDKNLIAAIQILQPNNKSSEILLDKYYNYIKQLQYDIADMLLVEAETGTIIYSSKKNPQFTLLKEPSNPLNHFFQQFNSTNQTRIVDLTHMTFIGTPIFLNQKKIGILIFQINRKNINNIMTYNNNWQVEKSGETGESYIVAIDGTMRNNSRKLVEYKEDYLLLVEQAGLSNDIIAQIDLNNTSIGLQIVNTPGTEAVFMDITGQNLYVDYHDEFVFATFTPLNKFGLQWTIFATIEENEVLELVTKLTDKITNTIIQIAVIILIIASLILWLIIPTKPPFLISKNYTVEQIISHIKKLP